VIENIGLQYARERNLEIPTPLLVFLDMYRRMSNGENISFPDLLKYADNPMGDE